MRLKALFQISIDCIRCSSSCSYRANKVPRSLPNTTTRMTPISSKGK